MSDHGINVRELAARAGFTGRALDTIVAIVMAESGGNPRAFNGNAHTGDQSYGLAQINMLGAMGPERRKTYGLSSNEDLFDPLTNLRVAYQMSNGGKNFAPWSTYKSGAYQKYIGSSGATVKTPAGSPPPPSRVPLDLGATEDVPAPRPVRVPDPLAGTVNSASRTPGIYESVMGDDAADLADPFDAPDTFFPKMTEQDFASLYSGNLTPNAAAYETEQSTFPAPENPRQADRSTPEASGSAGKVVRLAQSFVGTPYVWGGATPSGFDCSGFIQYVYRKVGVDLPRVSYQQANAGKRLPLSKAQPGDLIAWDNSTRNNGADHIAIYLGDGRIAESPRPGVPNRVRKLTGQENAWAVRVL